MRMHSQTVASICAQKLGQGAHISVPCACAPAVMMHQTSGCPCTSCRNQCPGVGGCVQRYAPTMAWLGVQRMLGSRMVAVNSPSKSTEQVNPHHDHTPSWSCIPNSVVSIGDQRVIRQCMCPYIAYCMLMPSKHPIYGLHGTSNFDRHDDVCLLQIVEAFMADGYRHSCQMPSGLTELAAASCVLPACLHNM